MIGAFVLVAIAGGITGVRQLDAASAAQVRLSNARDALDELYRTQLAAETGMRGYVATGERYFLDDPTGIAGDRFVARAGSLARELQASGLPDAAQRVGDLRATHERWVRYVETPLLADRKRPDALAKQTDGKILTDQMRMDDAVLRDEISAASTGVQATLRRRINTTVAASVGTIALFAIAALWFALGRAQAVRALAREQSLVGVLQQALRVDGVALPRTQVGFAYTSATREALVGGDLIDAWRADGDRGWFLIADVSGKGIQAARHAAFVQYAIRTLVAGCDDPAEIIARFNRLFLDTFSDPGIFVVLFVASFDARSGLLRYCSAGHGGAYVRQDASVTALPPTGALVGLDRDQAYEAKSVSLRPGDTIVLATDGLTEARDAAGTFLGDDGVIAIVQAGPAEPQALCDQLVAAVTARSGGVIADDLAILTLRVLAVDSPLEPVPFTAIGPGS